ncbi:MAG: hypothetical protein ACOZNI_30780 [Myxococcota bacterium]
MLTWTGAGATPRPKALQIRLQRSYPGRVRAGAPVPTRSMSTEEVEANLRHFTAQTPRGAPVESVVFSGVGAASRADLPGLCALARSLGVRRVTLHAGVEDLEGMAPAALPVDLLVLPLQPGESGATLAAGARALAGANAAGVPVVANAVLSSAALPLLPAIGRVAVAGRARSLAISFPFPVDGATASEAPPAPRAVAALREVVPAVEAGGVAVSLKGLPACYLGELARLLTRTANRWYVDADHQLDKALMFFPDVVAFHKDEGCRFCARDGECDGFFANYLRRPGFPALKAVG